MESVIWMKKYLYILLFLFVPIFAFALEFPSVNSKMVEIYDLTDKKVLYEVNSNDKASIASLTKIATTITAIENIDDLDEVVTITPDILKTVRWDASIAGLAVGDKVTYRDLLYASMLPSGADATNSLAILSSGSIDKFVEKMNDLANRIGLENTHFKNTTGLDDKEHFSTADDVRKLLSYALNNELFKEIYNTKEYKLSNGLIVKTTLFSYSKNSNIDTSRIIGSKTGFTLDAGYCLSSLSNINGHEMIMIVLKAENKNNTFYNIKDTMSLIDFMNENYKDVVLVKKDSVVKTLPVKLSKIDSYDIHASKDISKYLPSDYDINKLKIEYNGDDELSFKNHQGDKVGVVNYYYDGESIYTEAVIINQDIELSFKKIIIKYYLLIVLIIVILIIVLFMYSKKLNKKKRKNKKK